MKERPILFSGAMVRAILDGRKTQTRRVVKPLPSWQVHSVCEPSGAAAPWAVWFHFPETIRVGHLRKCPYGVPGDRLWVRETWASHMGWNHLKPSEISHDPDTNIWWAADSDGREGSAGIPTDRRGKWRPSIHMPRWASRITLEIADVRVQRVQEISERDAIAEGIDRCESSAAPWAPFLYCDYNLANPDDCAEWFASPIDSFMSLWDSINAKRGFGWDKNPWVWAVSFKRVSTDSATNAA